MREAERMTEAVIWTAPELVAFTRHEDDDVRAWAWGRLVLHYPEEAAPHAARGVADPSWSCVGRALDAVAKSPSAEVRKAVEAMQRRRDLPQGIRAHAARILRGTPEPQPIEDPDDPEIDQLAATPDELRRRAPELLASASDDDRTTALLALDRQPYRWAAEIILERLDALLATDSYMLAWDTLGELGDPRALPVALAEWRPGDRRLASIALQLHRLARLPSQGAISEELVRDADESERLVRELKERLRHGIDIAPPDGDLRLDLRCTRCRRVHEYDVLQACVHPHLARCREEGWDGVSLGRIVICKRCGAEDDYELTVGARALLAVSTRRVPGESIEERRSRPVVVAELRLWDGTLCKRPARAIDHLRALAALQPERGEGWRRLGNLCERYERMHDAVTAWTRAIADKDELEACYSLTKHHAERGRAQEAFDFAARTIERLHGGSGKNAHPAELRRTAAETALDVIRSTLPRSSEPLALMVGWNHLDVGETLTVALSSVDLREVRRWDRLVDLFASDSFVTAKLTPELPDEDETILGRLLESDAPIDGRAEGGRLARVPAPPVRSAPKPGRNEPCTCGSGKKFKKCCGR